MTEQHHERGHRTKYARTFLAVTFVLQRIADAMVIWFTFLPTSEVRLMRGLAIGSAVWTAALLAGVWRRKRWARYLLTSFNWLYVAAFSFAGMQRLDSPTGALPGPLIAVFAGVALYAAANVILIRSRRVRHFANS